MLPSELEEVMLLERCAKGEEPAIKQLLERYEPRIFGAMLALAACDRNAAYEAAVASLTDAVRAAASAGRQPFARALIPAVIRHAKTLTPTPKFEPPHVPGLPPERQQLLRVVKEALLALPFEVRLLLVLRDLLHLGYEEIAVVREVPVKQAKADTNQARSHLREKTKEMLERLA